MEEDLESVAEPFVENLENPEAKVAKSITKSFVELPEVPVQLSKLYPKLRAKKPLYLRLTPIKLIKLSNWSKLYLELALVELIKLSI